MKYIKLFFFFCLFFFITFLSVRAAKCALDDTYICVYDNYEIHIKNTGTKTILGVDNVDFVFGNGESSKFLDKTCPDNIKTVSGTSSNPGSAYENQIMIFGNSSANDAISLTEKKDCSTIDSISESEKKVVNKCKYGDYTIIVTSDKKIEVKYAGKIDRQRTYAVANESAFYDGCPKGNLNVSINTERGIDRVTLSLSDLPNSSTELYDEENSYEHVEQFTEDPYSKTDIPELKFCETTGVRMSFKIAGWVLFILKILVPLILIVMGIIDFAKAAISSEDKADSEAVGSLFRRVLLGIIIFFIPTILNLVFSLVDGFDGVKSDFADCTTCLLDPGNCSNSTIEGD